MHHIAINTPTSCVSCEFQVVSVAVKVSHYFGQVRCKNLLLKLVSLATLPGTGHPGIAWRTRKGTDKSKTLLAVWVSVQSTPPETRANNRECFWILAFTDHQEDRWLELFSLFTTTFYGSLLFTALCKKIKLAETSLLEAGRPTNRLGCVFLMSQSYLRHKFCWNVMVKHFISILLQFFWQNCLSFRLG